MLLRILSAAGAVLLTASLTTASSVSAEEPAPTAKLIFNPATGQIPVLNGAEGTGAIVSTDTPCPETHRYRFRFVLAKSDGSELKDLGRVALPADNIPALTDARSNFWTYGTAKY